MYGFLAFMDWTEILIIIGYRLCHFGLKLGIIFNEPYKNNHFSGRRMEEELLNTCMHSSPVTVVPRVFRPSERPSG